MTKEKLQKTDGKTDALEEAEAPEELSFFEKDWNTPPAARGPHDPDQQSDPIVYEKINAAQSLEQLMIVFAWLSGHDYYFGRTDRRALVFSVDLPSQEKPVRLRFDSISASWAAYKFAVFADELFSGNIFNAHELLAGGGIVASNNVLYRTQELLDYCMRSVAKLAQDVGSVAQSDEDAGLGIKFENSQVGSKVVRDLLAAFNELVSTLATPFSKDDEPREDMRGYEKVLQNIGEYIANADHEAALQAWKELDKQDKLPQIFAFDIILLHIIISNFAAQSSLAEKQEPLLKRLFFSKKKSIADFVGDSAVLQRYHTRMRRDLPFLTPVGKLSRTDAMAVENATARLQTNTNKLLLEQGITAIYRSF